MGIRDLDDLHAGSPYGHRDRVKAMPLATFQPL